MDFYSVILGFPVLASWEDHDGYDGTVLGLPDASKQLELLRSDGVSPSPTAEDQLVLYLGSAGRVEQLVARLGAAGFEPRLSPNPYWERHGASCFTDPDGYWLVLSPDAR